MGGAGLLDLAGISPKNRTAAIQTFLTASPTAAEDAAAAKDRRTALAREAEWQNRVARGAQDVVSWFARLGLSMDFLRERLGLVGNNINGASGTLPQRGANNQRTLAGALGQPVRTSAGGAHSVQVATGRTLANGTPEYVTAGPEVVAAYQRASQETGIPLSILLSQAAKESNLRSSVTAADGGMGIAQFMPDTVRSLLGKASTRSRAGVTVKNPFYGLRPDFTKRSKALPGTFNPYDMGQASQMQGFYDALNMNTVAGATTG